MPEVDELTDAQSPETEARRSVMALCAAAGVDELQALVAGIEARAQEIRPAETGLVMARGRIGGTGAPFNFGEVSVTRAACRLESGETGHAYLLGRDRERARLAALVDALWQGAHRAVIDARLAPLRDRIAARRDLQARRTAATRVDFFNLVRGED